MDRGLSPSRSQARDLIKRGCVTLAGSLVTKAGRLVAADEDVAVAAGAQPFVSRGGLKLAAAITAFDFEARGIAALDIGASTGGFAHVLLEAGAARVFAVDIGAGQLHPHISGDPRVIDLQGTDARFLSRASIPEPIGAIVADVSFISLTQVLPAALALAEEGTWLAALIKPQFEAGRGEIGKNGLVKSQTARAAAVAKVRDWLEQQPGWRVSGVIESPIAGGSGNREFLIGARRDA